MTKITVYCVNYDFGSDTETECFGSDKARTKYLADMLRELWVEAEDGPCPTEDEQVIQSYRSSGNFGYFLFQREIEVEQ